MHNRLPGDILKCVGNTSLLPLPNVVPKNGSRILLKRESENPTSAMKDRLTLANCLRWKTDARGSETVAS
jgi:cysteine synthase A